MPDNAATGIYSSLITSIDPLLEKYAIGREIFAAYGDQKFNAAMLIKSLVNSAPVNQETFYHFEDQPINQNLLTAAGGPYTAAGAGLPVTVNLDTSNNSSLTGTLPIVQYSTIIDPNNNNRVYEVVTVTNSAVTPSITLRPLDISLTISIAGGILLAIGAYAGGEGGGQPGGFVVPIIRRDFNLQILKAGLNFTGTAATNEASVDVRADSLGELYSKLNVEMPAGLGNTYVVRDCKEMEFRMMMQHNNLYYWAEPNSNTAVTETGLATGYGTIRAAIGLKRTTTLYGTPIPYTAGSATIGIFDQSGDSLDSNYVNPNRAILWLQGRKQYTEFEQLMTTNSYNTAIRYDKDTALPYVYGDAMAAEGKKYNFSFIGLNIGNYKYISMREPGFTDPNNMGGTGYDTPNLGFMVPLATTADPSNKVPKDSVILRYKALGGINRAYNTWIRNQAITNLDQYEVNMQANVGYEWWGAQRFIQVQGS